MTDDKADPKTAGERAFGPRPVPRDQPAAPNAPNGSAHPEPEGQPTRPAQPKAEAETQVRPQRQSRPQPRQTAQATQPPPQSAQPPRVKFDTSSLKSSYCNVCNGSSTREEVVLNFGINTTWDRAAGEDRLDVALHHRIIMSPHAAKRVRDMMVRLMEEHEARYGKLDG